jgi:hypothetical protein
MLKALVILPALCFAVVFAQVGGPSSKPAPGGPGPGPGGVNAVAAYVFGEENAKNAEELAEAVVNNLAQSRKYSLPRRGAREFFRAADKLQARNRGRLLEDRDFCKIGGDEGVQSLVIIDIEKAGRGNSVWARLLDLDNCRIVGTAEFTGLVRNTAEINKAASELSNELQFRRVGKRSIASAMAQSIANSALPPPPPPPPPRGDQIAGYVYGMENAKLGEDLAEAIVDGLASLRKYSKAKRGAREFYRQADKLQMQKRGQLLSDRDFCKIGSDYGVEYLVIIDIEKAGRGNSVWARILDLDQCTIIATGESTALIRNDDEVKKVADEIVGELQQRRIGTRGRR